MHNGIVMALVPRRIRVKHDNRRVVTVRVDVHRALKAFAQSHGLTMTEAVAWLLAIAAQYEREDGSYTYVDVAQTLPDSDSYYAIPK